VKRSGAYGFKSGEIFNSEIDEISDIDTIAEHFERTQSQSYCPDDNLFIP
jgi:hypothetical protein